MATCEWFDIAKTAVPSVLVIVGWGVVYFLQRRSAARQELRKELRAGLDLIRKDVRDLREMCISYFVGLDSEPDTPVNIRVLFDDLRRQSLSISSALLEHNEREQVKEALTLLGQNATGGSFETRDRKKLSPYDPQLQRIFGSGSKLLGCLEDGFEKKYPRR